MVSKLDRQPSGMQKAWTVIVVIIAVCMLAAAFTGLGANLMTPNAPTAESGGSGADATIGTVNGVPLSLADFNKHLDAYEQFNLQMGNTIPPEQMPQIRSDIVDEMVQDALLISQATKMGITVSDSEIQAARVKQIATDHLAQELSLPDNATIGQIDNALAAAGHSSTTVLYPDDQFRNQILLQKVHDAIDSQTVVSEADARAYYTQWHVRHILISNRTRSDGQALLMAQKITALAQAPGANFPALAMKYSEDPGTKSHGGDDSWIDHTTNYVPEFKNAAFTLKPGQITVQPVDSPTYGYFIIKCDAIRDNLPKDFAKNTANYISTVQSSERQDKLQTFISMLKLDPSTKIDITDPRIKGDQALASISTIADPAQRNLAYQAALTNYKLALSANPEADVAGQVADNIATIYQTLNDPTDELTYLKQAADATRSADITLQLGELYLANKDKADAIDAFKLASSEGWNEFSIHQTLLNLYKGLSRPDLAQSEQVWITNYNQQQKEAQASQQSPSGLPPGAGTPLGSVSVTPSGTSPAPVTVVSNGKPAGSPAKPAQ